MDRQTDGQTYIIATSISHINTVDVIYGSVHKSGTLRVTIGNRCSSRLILASLEVGSGGQFSPSV